SMYENLLPRGILAKASLRGKEYPWQFGDVEEVVGAARVSNLATLGGQAQFRVPEGTCELYWIQVDCPQNLGENWVTYTERSAHEVIARVRQIVANTDFHAEALQWPVLRERLEQGLPVFEHLCFVLYFEAQSD